MSFGLNFRSTNICMTKKKRKNLGHLIFQLIIHSSFIKNQKDLRMKMMSKLHNANMAITSMLQNCYLSIFKILVPCQF